jgi:membrane associated rhomboid family serine protease
MKPDKVFYEFQLWRLLTGAFLHSPDNWWHIVWNMLFLWFFGPDLEDLYGHKEFLAFYLTAGVMGNLLWGVTTLWEPLPINPLGEFIYPMALGASGAVMAVTVLCALHYPHRTILIMFVLPVPLWLWAVIMVAGDLFIFARGVNTGVAVAAHLGGAGFAFLYYHLDWRLLGAWYGLVGRLRRPAQPRLRVYREETPVPVSSRPVERMDEQLEAQADAVLEKLSREGMASLTPEERDILQRASERYKKKRS